MLSWKAGQSQLLVATDVAARGLHIKSLPYVINYDFPTNLDTYIHRVGRTGRLATDGHAYSFLTRNLAPLAKPLLELLQVCHSCSCLQLGQKCQRVACKVTLLWALASSGAMHCEVKVGVFGMTICSMYQLMHGLWRQHLAVQCSCAHESAASSPTLQPLMALQLSGGKRLVQKRFSRMEKSTYWRYVFQNHFAALAGSVLDLKRPGAC